MALIYPVTLSGDRGSRDLLGCVRIQYQNVAAGDTCDPVSLARYADRSVQVTGDYSGGASVSIQGTCEDKTNFAVLTSSDGLELTFTSGVKTKWITEATAYTVPVVSGGDGSTSLTITFFCRGQVA